MEKVLEQQLLRCSRLLSVEHAWGCILNNADQETMKESLFQKLSLGEL